MKVKLTNQQFIRIITEQGVYQNVINQVLGVLLMTGLTSGKSHDEQVNYF